MTATYQVKDKAGKVCGTVTFTAADVIETSDDDIVMVNTNGDGMMISTCRAGYEYEKV